MRRSKSVKNVLENVEIKDIPAVQEHEETDAFSDFEYIDATDLDDRYDTIMEIVGNRPEKMVFVMISSMSKVGVSQDIIDDLMNPVLGAIKNALTKEQFEKVINYIEIVIRRKDRGKSLGQNPMALN